jgi:hypothetical protein
MFKFENEAIITIRSGKTGDILYETSEHNAISDDILGAEGHIYTTPMANTTAPYCFLLPDGSNWSGFTYDRTNPYAPYCISVNNSVDTSAEPFWKTRTTYTAPSNTVTGRHKLFFQWSNLPFDFQLKAIGLTGWQSDTSNSDMADYNFGAGTSVNQQATIFVPQTLVVLPGAVLIHGRNGGSGTPDVLQVSYFLSIVGTS